MLDRLNAMLAVKYQAQERKLGSKSVDQLDSRTLQFAKKYLETVKVFFGDKSRSGTRGNDTTLFASSEQSLSNELFEESKLHFTRAVSFYHSLALHDLCSQWSDLLQGNLEIL